MSPYNFNVLQSEPVPGPANAVYPAVAQFNPAAGGTIPVPNEPDTSSEIAQAAGVAGGHGCGLLNTAVMLPAETAVTVTTSKFWPASTSNSILENMFCVEVTARVCGTVPAATGPVMVTGRTADGKEIRPACPISCCSSSVALRTLVCISVRFATVP